MNSFNLRELSFMSNFKDVYQKFIHLSITSEALSEFPRLEPIEQRILNLLSSNWLNKKPITVVETMNMTNEISSSTVFRYLKSLRLKGYIALVIDEVDNRVKYVSSTKQTEKYFDKLGRLITEATK